jgi:hypothetical protein
MLEVVALAISAASLLAMLVLSTRIRALEQRQQELESHPQASLPAPVEEKPLAGQTVRLQIEQDHPSAPFAALLRDQLAREDVAITAENSDLEIRGSVRCNGYADIYFGADLTCYQGSHPICTVLERPPHGDRPLNLATDLIARLKREIQKSEEHSERHRALKELKSR